jgi:O-acetyl-ADP-ribose deacetylase (regulator of RNase III)
MAGSNAAQVDLVRFGRTAISVEIGELVDQPVEILIASGNKRAMFAAGAAGTLWSAAGEEVERELRSHAPLELGTAAITGSGRLGDRGVLHIVHAIVAPGLGEPARPLLIPDAIEHALDLVSHAGGRSFAISIIGASATARPEERLERAEVVIDAIVAHLRTRKHRIERGILVSRFEDDRAPLESLVVRARERRWTS